jgi:uncharacterized protein (TIRG00374 family)
MRKRYWLGIAISAALLFLMFRSVDFASVGRAFSQADFVFLIPALALYFAGVFVRSIRWGVLLGRVQRLGLKRLFLVVVIGYMANDILPFRAGEAVRAFLLWRDERIEPGTTVATIVVERILDGLVLTAFLILAGLVLPLENWLTQLAWVAGVVFVIGIGVLFGLTVVPGPIMAVAGAILSPMPRRIRNLGLRLLGTFVDGLGILRSARETVAVLGLSAAAWGLEAGMYYVLMYSFPFQPRYLAATLGTAVANLGTMIPSSPGYVGTFDLPLNSVLTGTFGVNPSIAAGYTILVHAALLVPVSLLGLFFLWREGLTLKGITSRAAESEIRRNDATGTAA